MQGGDCFLGGLTREEADKAAALAREQAHALNPPELLHLLLHELLSDLLRADVAHEEGGHVLVFWRGRQLGLLLNFVHYFLGDGVVYAVKAVPDFVVDGAIALFEALQVLVGDVGVAVGACDSPVAVALDEERADVGGVPLGRL